MEHFLLHLSYSPSGWRAITAAGASFDDRLAPVRKLVAHLGGSFAQFHFFDKPDGSEPDTRSQTPHHVVRDKFCMFGSHDLLAVLAMPNKTAAQALMIALSSQDGIEDAKFTALMPFEDTVTIAATASAAAIAATQYTGPGGTTHK